MTTFNYDLSGVSSNLQHGIGGGVIVWNTNHFTSTTDGSTLTNLSVPLTAVNINDLASKNYVDALTHPFDMAIYRPTQANANETIVLYTIAPTVTFLNNFSGSTGSVEVNPSAPYTCNIERDGVVIGSLTVSTSGSVSFATIGSTTEIFTNGQKLRIVAPPTTDSSLAGLSITLAGTTHGVIESALLLDNYPTSLRAGGFRLLTSGYTGSCCQIRRSTDSATLDIGFANGVVDTNAIITFCGASDGFISILYDQNQISDFIPSSTLAQPMIYTGGSGTVITNGKGMPSMRFTGSQTNLRTPMIPSTNLSINIVMETLNTDTEAVILWDGNSSSNYTGVIQSGSTTGLSSNAGSPILYVDSSVVNPATRGTLFNTFNAVANQSNVLSIENVTTTGWSSLQLFGYAFGTGSVFQYTGLLSEIVIWNSSEITTSALTAAATKSQLDWV